MSRAAIRYAKAILETAVSSGKANQVNDDMKSIIAAVDSSADLKEFLASPIIKSDLKMNALLEVFGSVQAERKENGKTQKKLHLWGWNPRPKID